MGGTLQPLDKKFAIVDERGNPTDYFIRWAQQKQIDIAAGITAAQANDLIVEYLDDHRLREGSGIQLTPTGDITDEPVIAADVQEILDQISATRGVVLYRGLLEWAALAPGTAGYVLSTNGAGADPSWVAQSGGGGGSTPTIRASKITSSSNNSYTITWPTGTIAGDVVVVLGGHGFGINIPAGWAQLDKQDGSNFNGAVFGKVMTAGDISTGSVTITTAGSYNGVFALVTLIGVTRMVDCKATRAGAGASPVTTPQLLGVLSTDLIICLAANRGASNNDITNTGAATLDTVNASEASGRSESLTGVSDTFGVAITGTYSTTGSGYYIAGVAFR